MDGVEIVFTAENYITILKIYISKKSSFEKIEFCKLVDITQTNTITYNRIVDILEHYGIGKKVCSISNLKGVRIIIDRKELENFILKTKYYKLNDKFMHTCMFGCITP